MIQNKCWDLKFLTFIFCKKCIEIKKTIENSNSKKLVIIHNDYILYFFIRLYSVLLEIPRFLAMSSFVKLSFLR